MELIANGIQTQAKYKDGRVDTEVMVVDKSSSEPKKPRLLKTLINSFLPMFLVSLVFKLIHDILMFISPQLLK